MNHYQAKELAKREARRALILAHVCPECNNQLYTNPEFEVRSPKFTWFSCVHCHSTMGVSKHYSDQGR